MRREPGPHSTVGSVYETVHVIYAAVVLHLDTEVGVLRFEHALPLVVRKIRELVDRDVRRHIRPF